MSFTVIVYLDSKILYLLASFARWHIFQLKINVSSSAFVFLMPSIMIMVLKQLIYLALNMLSLIWLFVGPEAFLCLPRPLLPCPIPPPLPPKKHKAKSPLSFSFAKQLRESILFSASPFQVFSPNFAWVVNCWSPEMGLRQNLYKDLSASFI